MSAHAVPAGTSSGGQSKTDNRALEQRDHTRRLDREMSISVRGICISSSMSSEVVRICRTFASTSTGTAGAIIQAHTPTVSEQFLTFL